MEGMTVTSFFTAVGETIAGLITSAVNVFTGLWSSGVPGQVVCSLGFASMAIGLGMTFFKMSKGKKRK